jgi:hypothetical protein
VILGALLVFAVLIAALVIRVGPSGTAAVINTPTPSTVGASAPYVFPPAITPVPVTRDLDPSMAPADKSEVIIRFVDGHQEKWLVPPTGGLDMVKSQLPTGAQIAGFAPSASHMGRHVEPDMLTAQPQQTTQPTTPVIESSSPTPLPTPIE